MKISELMEKLGEIQGTHGDIDIYIWEDWGMDPLLGIEIKEANRTPLRENGTLFTGPFIAVIKS